MQRKVPFKAGKDTESFPFHTSTLLLPTATKLSNILSVSVAFLTIRSIDDVQKYVDKYTSVKRTEGGKAAFFA